MVCTAFQSQLERRKDPIIGLTIEYGTLTQHTQCNAEHPPQHGHTLGDQCPPGSIKFRQSRLTNDLSLMLKYHILIV